SFFIVASTLSTDFSLLSLHDALPISRALADLVIYAATAGRGAGEYCSLSLLARASRPLADASAQRSTVYRAVLERGTGGNADGLDRKSTRLNSSHVKISYAVICLKKK